MTRDDIISMAREAGMLDGWSLSNDMLEQFAALVAAAERKRFAEECIDLVAFHGGSVEIEADIRSRVDL